MRFLNIYENVNEPVINLPLSIPLTLCRFIFAIKAKIRKGGGASAKSIYTRSARGGGFP